MVKMTISFLALLAGSAAAFDFLHERRLDAHGHAAIAGYAPGSDVVQHNMLDLDQADLEAYLKEAPVNFAAAKKIYLEGGHSGGYAQFTLATPLAADLAKGTAVTQAGVAGATGKVKSSASAGDTTIKVSYTSVCEGAATKDPDTTGCFAATGDLTAGASLGAPSALVNKYRNLAGFSTAAGDKMAGQPYYEAYRKYYDADDYGHQYVMAALDGTGGFAGKEDIARIEGIKKGTVYMNVWMYVIREFEDAIDDCKVGCIDCNDDPVHAWDEGVAFYTGSLAGTDGEAQGKMLWALANKRCKNFATCGAAQDCSGRYGCTAVKAEDRLAGTSQVNMLMFPLFAAGRDALQAGKCSELRSLTDKIVALMSVPQVQGSLRYAYKVGELGEGAKSKAEGAVFAGAILPRVHQCNPKAAEVIHANMKIDADPPMAAGFAAVKAAFESTYHCMGFSCDHVGGLWLGGDTNYHPGAEPCADHAKIAGYAPGSSVVQHNQLDLDQAELEGFLKEKPPNFAAAKKIYNQGGNSGGYAHVTLATPLAADLVKGTAMTQVGNAKAVGKAKSGAKAGDLEIKISYMSVCKAETSGVKTPDTAGCFTTTGDIHTASKVSLGAPSTVENKYRTLAGFSTAAKKKMTGQPHFEHYKAYYGAEDYGHQYVTSALDGTGSFAGKEDIARIEGVKKGTVYMNVWMYVIREFEDAIDDCKAGCIDCNDDPVHAWDEGVAFYTGTLAGEDGSGEGKMLWALANKRCKNFGTCNPKKMKLEDRLAGVADVNMKLFELFDDGRDALQAGKCDTVRPLKDKIVDLMTVPQVQGTLRYAYKVGVLEKPPTPKSAAEGAVFSGAILGRLNACNPDVAKLVAKNMDIDAAEPMVDGFTAVKEAIESCYDSMGIMCSDVGGLWLGGETVYHPDAEPCVDVVKEGESAGSCYDDPDSGGPPHSVQCNVPEENCNGMKWYPPGFVSSRNGCCHCKASCTTPDTGECKYYPSTYAEEGDESHDGHDGHDDHGDEKKEGAPAPAPAAAPGPAPGPTTATGDDSSNADTAKKLGVIGLLLSLAASLSAIF